MSVTIRSFSGFLHSPQIAIKEIALKEWAVCIEALAAGDQFILLRKGGIMEETREFRIEDASFYLYPTYEHQKANLIKRDYQDKLNEICKTVQIPPRNVTISYIAHVTDDIQITEEEDLKALAPYHVLTDEYAAERLRWRPKHPLHILIVRAYRLDEPKTIRVVDDYIGCKSWISLQEAFDGIGSSPVISDDQFFQTRLDILSSLHIKPNH